MSMTGDDVVAAAGEPVPAARAAVRDAGPGPRDLPCPHPPCRDRRDPRRENQLHRPARAIGRYRIVIDRNRHRARKAKCASTFPRAGRADTATRIAPAVITPANTPA